MFLEIWKKPDGAFIAEPFHCLCVILSPFQEHVRNYLCDVYEANRFCVVVVVALYCLAGVWKWYLPYDNNKVPNCCVIFLTLKQINLLKRSFFHIEQTMPLKEKQLNGNCYLCFMFWLRLRVCMLFLYSFSTLPMTSLRISLWLFIATSCCCCCFFISV